MKRGVAAALVCVGVAGLVACGGGAGGPGPTSKGQDYQEYECPAPIGKIVREDCSRSALQYEGQSFEGSVGAAGVGASASYRETAIRQAADLVQLLKEQRVALCNNFNTCKLTVAEYRDEQKHLDDSFIALMALKDKMSSMDANGATQLLRELQSIRSGVAITAATSAPPAGASATAPAPSASAAPAASTPPVAASSAGFSCRGPAVQLFRRGTIAGPTFAYDKTRENLKGHPELASVEFYEFLLESASLSGTKQEYVLVGVCPDSATADKLKSVVRSFSPSAGADINCPAIAPARKLEFDVK